MLTLIKTACLIILATLTWSFSAVQTRADASCTITQNDISHFLDAETEECRTSGSYPDSGAMVRADFGSDYVIMDGSYAAGFGEREPTDLHCIEGVCGVGIFDSEGGLAANEEVVACEGSCRAAFSYKDEYGNTKTVDLNYDDARKTILATLSGRSGPPEIGVMTASVPTSLPSQSGVFELTYEFSELARTTSGSSKLPVEITGGVLDTTTVVGTRWTARIVPLNEGIMTILLPGSSMEGSLAGAPLDGDYTTQVPIDLSGPVATLSYVGVGQGPLDEVFSFESSDPASGMPGTPSVTVTGVNASVAMDMEEERFIVTADGPGVAQITLDAGAYVDGAGNTSPASNTISFDFGNRVVDVISLEASQTTGIEQDDAVSFTATVSPAVNAGAIEFSINGDLFDVANITNGQATTTTLLPVGTSTVGAVFRKGNSAYEAGTAASVDISVDRSDLSIVLQPISSVRPVDEEILITGTISAGFYGDLVVQVSKEGGIFEDTFSDVSSSNGNLTVSFIPDDTGLYILRVFAEQSEGFEETTSNEISFSVANLTAGGSVLAERSSYAIGDRPVLTATMDDPDMTGQIVFSLAGVEVGSVALSDGSAIFVADPLLRTGDATYSATYIADDPWSDQTLGSVTVDVSKKVTSGELTLDKSQYSIGDIAVATANLIDADATGAVTFSVDGEVVGTRTIANGVATMNLPIFQTSGFHSVEGEYVGDDTYEEVSLFPVMASVEQEGTALTLRSDATTYNVGGTIDLTSKVAPLEATGTVTFFIDGMEIGSSDIASGTARLSYVAQYSGSYTFTSNFTGSGDYSDTASNEVVVSVGSSQAQGSFSTDAGTYSVGQNVLVTVVFGTQGVEGDIVFSANGFDFETVQLSSDAATGVFTIQEAGTLRLGARYLGSDQFDAITFAPVDVTVTASTVGGDLSLSDTTYTVGEQARATATLDSIDATGSVSFFVDDAYAGIADVIDGSAELSLAPWLRAGNFIVTASYSGDESYGAFDFASVAATVTAGSSFMTLDADKASYMVDERATLTATVTPSSATGQVVFRMDGTEIGQANLVSGTAILTAQTFDVSGSVSFSATYEGDDAVEPASASDVVVEVTQVDVTIDFSINSQSDQVSVFVDEDARAIVRLSQPKGDGRIVIMRDGTEVASDDQSGQTFFFDLDAASEGSFIYTAHLVDSASFSDASSTPVEMIITRTPTTSTLRVSNAAPALGEEIQLFAEVSPDTSGMVVFRDAGRTLSTAAVISGTAQTSLIVQNNLYEITAEFMPSDTRIFLGSMSDSVTVEAGKRPLSITLNDTQVYTTPNSDFAISGSVSDAGFTGSLNLMRRSEGGSFIQVDATQVANSLFSFNVAEAVIGEVSYRIELSGSAVYAASPSSVLTVYVEGIPANGDLQVSAQQVIVGDSVVARFIPGNSEVNGFVRFYVNGVASDPVQILNGEAAFSMTASQVGETEIYAAYAGSEVYAAYTTPTQIVIVDKQSVILEISTGQERFAIGDTARIVVTTQSSPAPTGIIEFIEDGSTFATAQMVDGRAEVERQFFSAGSFTYSALFNGSATFNPANTQVTKTIEVARADTQATLIATPETVRVGEAIELKVSVAPDTATGTISFYQDGNLSGTVSLAQGVAVLNVTTSRAGDLSFTARYSGDTQNDPIEDMGSTIVVVTKRDVAATLSSDKTRYALGESAIVTVTFDELDVSGMVEFSKNGQSIGMAPLSEGSVSVSTTLSNAGDTTFSAIYSGSDRTSGFSPEVIVVSVVSEPSTITLDPINPAHVAGNDLRLSGDVSVNAGTNPDFSGLITIEEDAGFGFVSVGTTSAQSGTQWSATIKPEGLGDRQYRASIVDVSQPDGTSYSNIQTTQIARLQMSLDVSTSKTSYYPGETAAFAVTVQPESFTGSIDIVIDGAVSGSVFIQSGSGQFDYDLTQEGQVAAQVSFDGNETFEPASSEQILLTARRDTSSLVLSAGAEEVSVGDQITLTANLSPASNGETIRFMRGGVELASALTTAGEAKASITASDQGASTFEAEFSGTSQLTASRSNAVTVQVARKTVSGVISSDAQSYSIGDTAMITVQMTPNTVPGFVQFLIEGSVVDQIEINNGIAVAEIPLAQEGLFEVHARTSGDGVYAPWQSETAAVISVDRDLRSISFSASDRDVFVGESVSLFGSVSGDPVQGRILVKEMIEGSWATVATVDLVNNSFSTSVQMGSASDRTFRAELADHAVIAATPSGTASVSAVKYDIAGTLTSDKSSYEAGQTAQFVVTLSPQAATGIVDLIAQGEVVDQAELQDGQAFFSAPLTKSGSFEYSAQYAGDSAHKTWQTLNPVSIDVALQDTSISLQADMTRVDMNDTVNLTATISPAIDGGMIEFIVNGSSVGQSVIQTNRADISYTVSDASTQSVQAVYAGSDRFAASQSNQVQIAYGYTSVTGVIETDAQSYNVGGTASVTVQLFPQTVTGIVEFWVDGVVASQSSMIDGFAAAAIGLDTEGTISINARYAGDDEHDAWQNEQPIQVVVGRELRTLTLTASDAEVAIGDSVTLVGSLSGDLVDGRMTISELQGDQWVPFVSMQMTNNTAQTAMTLNSPASRNFRVELEDHPSVAALPSEAVVVRAQKYVVDAEMSSDKAAYVTGETAQLVVIFAPVTATGTVDLLLSGQVVDQAEIGGAKVEFSVPLTKAGSFDYSARYAGDEMHAGWESSFVTSISVALQATSLSLDTDTSRVQLGDIVNLTATISPDFSGEFIDFIVNGSSVGQAELNAGQASVSYEVTEEGVQTIHAVYAGSDQFEGSQSTQVQIAFGSEYTDVTGVIEADAQSYSVGGTASVTAQLMPQTVTGVVEFLLNGEVVSQASMIDGFAAAAIRLETEGEALITARYEGSDEYSSWVSEQPIQVTVGRDLRTLSLTASETEVVIGDGVTLSGSLSGNAVEGGVMILELLDDVWVQVSSVEMTGNAYGATVTMSNAGARTFRAELEASATVEALPSDSVTVSAQKQDVVGDLTSDKASYVLGDTATVTASLTPATATGIVELIFENEVVEQVEVLDGVASFTTLLEDAGRFEINARYLGDETHSAWASQTPVIIETTLQDISLTLEAIDTEGVPGSTVRFRLTVAPDPAQGEVQIIIDGEDASIGSANALPTAVRTEVINLDGRGTYEIVATMPQAGSLSVEAQYEGNGTYASARSGAVVITAPVRDETSVSLTISDTSPFDGDTVSLSARVDPELATGSISFVVDDVIISTQQLASGTALATWQATSGDHTIVARYAGDEDYLPSSATRSVFVASNVLELFEQRRDFIEGVMDNEIDRAAAARARQTERHMGGVRERLRSEDGIQLPRNPSVSDNPGSWVGSVWEPFQYQGDVHGTEKSFDANGKFSARRRMSDDLSHLIEGGFEMTSQDGYGTSMEGNVSTSIEKRVADDAIIGATVGAEVGSTSIDGSMQGEMNTSGVSAGVYGAKLLRDNVVLDGFANVARLSHDLELEDDALSATSTYGSTAVEVGGTLSGKYELGNIDFLPAVTLRHTMAARDRADFAAKTATEAAQAEVAARTTQTSRVELVPEVQVHAGRDGDVTTSIKPKVICESKTETQCGVGIGVGVEIPVAQGRGAVKAEAGVETVGDRTRQTLFFGFELTF